ncbi:hypothetical protein [Mucilaginibacter polytrichastri]|uniref:Uncharacterized protein n=1 Tax=Mucilaginibacter polytrichastri TaxID=1302689 RepID=A0A1Q5ZVW7_9SPHI|nr:hypothetical protein [Mucilaginibacter polytrichastri]OKS85911.1 hypothetical protein RG47T_1357 [Mucilaginibacter polytrichastri]SFS60635.1 hypothetical protein SAMN04487890_102225 [Mucilaginibacter polytrichastri]
MNTQLNLAQMGLENISLEDAMKIDGGDYSSGYAAGQYVRKIVDGVGLLDFLYTVAKAL